MSIWSKVLIGLIAVATLPFFYLAARTLRTHEAWRGEVAKYQQAIAREKEQYPILLNGGPNQVGARELKIQLHGVLVDRGRVWRTAGPGTLNELENQPADNAEDADAEQPAAADEPGLQATVTIEEPDPHQLDDQTLLHVFDARPIEEGGSYLGQFKVVGIGEEGVVVLETATRFTPTARARLQQSSGPWLLYEVMPTDSHAIFEGLERDELASLLPGSTLEEYVRDGSPAEPTDPPERVVDGKYVRALRDYGVWFHEDARLRTIEIDVLAESRLDLKYMNDSHAIALEQEQSRNAEIEKLERQLARLTRERDAVVQRENEVEARLEEVRAQIEELIDSNRRLAGQWAEQQQRVLEAARQADADDLQAAK